MPLKYVQTVNSSGDLNTEFDSFLINANSSSIVFTLPEIMNDGQYYCMKRIDASILTTVTIQGFLPQGSSRQTIDGANSISLLPGNRLAVLSFNGAWHSFI